jgi:hypothetical protein
VVVHRAADAYADRRRVDGLAVSAVERTVVDAVQQRPVSVGAETFVLDAACGESMLAVEMDGAAWHGSRAQRESDIRRDALVATVGWQTLRFSHRRNDRLTRRLPARHPGRACRTAAAAARQRWALMHTSWPENCAPRPPSPAVSRR